MSDYRDFLARKRRVVVDLGHDVDDGEIHPSLFDFQRAMVRWALRKGRAAIFADTGLGKAQPADEMVLTPGGWRPIGSLGAGDEVISVDGRPTRVTGVYPQGERRVSTVRFNDGVTVRCDDEHLWTVATDLDISRGVAWRTISTSEIVARGIVGPDGRARWRVPIVAPVQHPERQLAIEPYVLGVLLGDGTFRRPEVQFTSADPEIATEVKARLPVGMRLSIDVHDQPAQGYRVVVAGRTNHGKTNPYLDAIKAWGLAGRLAHEKFVPDEYMVGSAAQRLDLLRGLMDTDGYVSAEGTVQFGSSSPRLADQVAELVRSLGGVVRRTRKLPTYTYRGERRVGREHYTLTVALPNGCVPFVLPRKVDRCRGRFYQPQRKIVQVTPAGRAECVCIAVEHPSSLYITRGHVVTHNTRMQVEWARLTGERTLILAPLAVAHQTVREAADISVDVRYVRNDDEADAADVEGCRILITNYERLHLFTPSTFGAVVLDESSILKSFSGTTKKALVAGFADTPYRLACTATPAPNDLEELCNHADFLGVMKPSEMRSTFFIADSRGEFMRYRLKRHAKDAFFGWLASWAMAVKRPSDLGFDDGPFELPGLEITPHFVETDYVQDGQLFTTELHGVTDQARVRRETMADRVARAVEIVRAEPDEPWLIWCGLNDEAKAVAAAIDDAVNVQGSDQPDHKAERLAAFADGGIRVLVTKAGIAGFGMNFQRCAHMVFVGLGYSYEAYYQALRRCHRFGQTRPVQAHIVLSEPERSIYAAVLDKERQALELSGGLLEGMRDLGRAQLFAGTSKGDSYEPSRSLTLPSWLVAS